MNKEIFKKSLLDYFDEFKRAIADENDEWVIKGFIDVYRNIYTISIDTKVISKIIELLIFPIIGKFASSEGYKIIPSKYQNYYPDITLISKDNEKIAVDIKTTYIRNSESINGFTLGSFTGYFRDRKSNKNITFPYDEYSAHYVLGVLYQRSEEDFDEYTKYSLDELDSIVSVVKNFEFILEEKWKISSDKPGSGNTKNIGSIKNTNSLRNGNGPFSELSEKIFDDYWKNFLTKDMAQSIDSKINYKNIEEYLNWIDSIK
ncbi:MAG: hypothetical protein LBD03_02760 [Methanobrevibacter sp.]|jgi:hypothetical protein|nr:hypothetical protein [Candidatus Methanovirga procula]